MIIEINKTYKVNVREFDLGEDRPFDLFKVCQVIGNKVIGYLLEYPNQKIGTYNKYLIPLIPELDEIKKIKFPKINQDDINNLLIDLNTKEV